MPEIFRLFGFSFFFFSREHEPVHIHVEGNGGYAVFDLVDSHFVLRDKHNIKSKDMKRIESAIEDNRELIIRRWKNHFDKPR